VVFLQAFFGQISKCISIPIGFIYFGFNFFVCVSHLRTVNSLYEVKFPYEDHSLLRNETVYLAIRLHGVTFQKIAIFS
jgi:hypothetical protein